MKSLYFRKRYSIALVILLAFLLQIPFASFAGYVQADDVIVVDGEMNGDGRVIDDKQDFDNSLISDDKFGEDESGSTIPPEGANLEDDSTTSEEDNLNLTEPDISLPIGNDNEPNASDELDKDGDADEGYNIAPDDTNLVTSEELEEDEVIEGEGKATLGEEKKSNVEQEIKLLTEKELPISLSSFDDVEMDVVKKITAKLGDKELKDIENYRPKKGDEITLQFEFELPDKHNYGDGSTLTYTLPNPLTAYSGEGPLTKDGEEYATYRIHDGKVVVTFNEKIRFEGQDGGSEGLKTEGWFGITAKFAPNDIALKQMLELPGNDPLELYFQPEGGTTIKKSAEAENNGDSSTFVKWTVWVNTLMNDLGIAGKEFIDTLTGKHTYKPASLKITQLELGNDGSPISEQVVTNSFVPNWAQNNKSFTLNLTGKYAYKIEYETIPDDTDNAKETLENNATFDGKLAFESKTIKFGDPLAKSVSKSGETANWTIKVNGNRKTLASGLRITDSWDSDKHKMVENSFKVKFEDGTELDSTYYTKEALEGEKGFILTLNEEITEPFTITYSTIPKDLVTETINIQNEVVRSDRPAENQKARETAYYSQNVLSKINNNINYQNKTVDWKIELNNASYTMNEIVLEDTFVHKNLKIVAGTFKVQMNGQDLEYTCIDKDGNIAGDKKGGFTLEISDPIDKPVTITYTTDYDVRGVDNLDQYKNTADLSWKTEGNNYSVKDVTSHVVINAQQKDKGYKTGVYNYEGKKFHWSVGVNYNFDTVENPVFTDILPESQNVLRNSIKVYELDLSNGGNGVIKEPALTEGTDYILTPAGQLANTFTITFNKSINKPYRINYESVNKDEYYAPTDNKKNHKVENNANLNSIPWKKSVEVKHTNTLLTKNFSQVSNSAKLNWKMELNWGQSTLSDVVITDTVGKDEDGNPNQMVYKDSFKIYEMNFEGTNSTPKKSTEPIDASLYTVIFADDEGYDSDENSTFKISFKGTITKAYTIEYDTYFLGASGQTVENTAKVSYRNKDIVEGEDSAIFSKANFSYFGGAFTKKGQLEIIKVDKDDPNKKLSGAEFELWNAKEGGFLIERVSSDIDGVYNFKTKVGQATYYLKETKAPVGYCLEESEYKDLQPVTIDSELKSIEIKNTKLMQAVQLTKLDVTDNKKLAGAKFELFNADNDAKVEDKAQPFTTNDEGTIMVNNLAPGKYYFKEVKAPDYYLLPDETNRKTEVFEITANQIKVITLEMTNTRGVGEIILSKVDGAGNTPLKDVEFKLVNSLGTIELTGNTDDNGKIEFTNLPYDTYILTEISTNPNYVLDTTPQEVFLNNETKEVTIENTKKDYSVRLTKYNADKKLKLQGAVFELWREIDGEYVVVDEITAEQLTTDENGEIYLELAVGNYQFIEINAPSGYRINNEPVKFEILENQTATTEVEKTNIRRSSGGGGGGFTPPEQPEEESKDGDKDNPKEEKLVKLEELKKDDPKTLKSKTLGTVKLSNLFKEETPKDTPKEGSVEVPEKSVTIIGEEPKNGFVTVDTTGKWVYTPNSGFVGKDTFTILITDENGNKIETLFEIEVDEVSLGSISVHNKLPKTGADSYLICYLIGFSLVILGLRIRRKFS